MGDPDEAPEDVIEEQVEKALDDVESIENGSQAVTRPIKAVTRVAIVAPVKIIGNAISDLFDW